MHIFELTQTEDNEVYRQLEASNGSRQYHFLQSLISAAVGLDRPYLSSALLKALNYHAIACLHTNAGEYRPHAVCVGGTDPKGKRFVAFQPPEHFRVQALMDDFVNMVNRNWERTEPLTLAAYVLWHLNHIHPFVNGNGRTARAACYFVICVTAGGWLPGHTILPELIRQERDQYCKALAEVDKSYAEGRLVLNPLIVLLTELLQQQLQSSAGDSSSVQ